MADGNKTDQIPDELENLSPEELQERIQEEKKNDGEEESLHGGMPGGHCGRSKLSCQK